MAIRGMKNGKEMEKSGSASTKESRNQSRMQLIRKVHEVMSNDDIEKQRQSQMHVGTIVGSIANIIQTDFRIGDMHAEWVNSDKAHRSDYVILYCHGGGYSTGSCAYARTVTTKLAGATLLRVLSFDYRLAPEHPYPAALEDAMEAWNYLMLQGYGADHIFIAGDSAGGNLALALALKLKEEGRFLPKALVLFSPWTDLTCAGESFLEKEDVDPILHDEYLYKMIENYASGLDLSQPLISPLFGDYAGFPPTYIQVGENEVLLSDSLRLKAQMEQASVKVRLDVYKGMWHVFQMAPFKKAAEAVNQVAEFVFEVLSGQGGI